MMQASLANIPHWFLGPFGFLLLCNVLLTTIVIAGMTLSLRAYFSVKKITAIATVLCLSIPFIAPLAFIVFSVLLYSLSNQPKRYHFAEQHYPIFANEKDSALKDYRVGELIAQLHNKTLSESKRLQALIRLNQQSSKEINQVNVTMLQQDADELRLYAYGVLNRQEMHLYEKIYQLEEKLTITTLPARQFLLYKALCYCFWTLIIGNLVDETMQQFAINKLQTYLEKAGELEKHDVALLLLFGKLKMRQQADEQAMLRLHNARDLGAPTETIIADLAEIAFRQQARARPQVPEKGMIARSGKILSPNNV